MDPTVIAVIVEVSPIDVATLLAMIIM